MTLETLVSVNALFPCYETGAYAFVGDPLNLELKPGLQGSVIPVPGSLLLVGIGLGCLTRFRRLRIK